MDTEIQRFFGGSACSWPEIQQWEFSELARGAPETPVRLVNGDREYSRPCFVESSLRADLVALGSNDIAPERTLYLKEFDLLDAFPELRADFRDISSRYHNIFAKLDRTRRRTSRFAPGLP